ncbi:MAG TPA: hypothetical protein VGN49_02925 [Micrococcaceae bacterium]|jgi:hypothetical protein|nr:hypothetical protein [Micrococcaceae bacterium]
MTEQEFDPDGNGPGTQRNTTTEGQPAVLGPFTLRDIVVLASVLVMLVGSLLPIVRSFSGPNLWNGASLFFIGIGIVLPLVVAGLFLARRLAPKANGAGSNGPGLRIGSLSMDQFASVVAAFAAAFFFLSTVAGYSLGFLVDLIGSLGLLVSTVLAPMLPFFAADFTGRTEIPAHPVARQAHSAIAQPAVRKTPGAKVGDRKAQDRKSRDRIAAEARMAAVGQQAGPGPADWSAAAEQQLAHDGSPIPSPVWGSGTAPYPPVGNQPAGNQPEYQSAAYQEASGSGVPQETAEPEQPAAGSHQAVPEPAAAPELSQYLGTAAAAGGVGAAASALPAEGQSSWGTAPDAVQHGEGLHDEAPHGDGVHSEAPHGDGVHAGAGHLPDVDSGNYPHPGEQTLLHPAIQDDDQVGQGAPAEAGHREPADAAQARTTEAGHTAPDGGGQGPASDVEHAAEQAARRAASQPPTAVHETVRRQPETIGATVDPATRQQQHAGFGHEEADRPVYEAFWFAVDRPRAVVDEKTGGFLYNLEPGNWILALQDRGHDFLVQNTDGRVGVLRDLSNIERAPEGE